jgi:hypothetical protein
MSQSGGVSSPSAHEYLGPDLETVRERILLEPDTIHQLVLFPLHNVILFPGETIPLRILPSSFQKINELTRFYVTADTDSNTVRPRSQSTGHQQSHQNRQSASSSSNSSSPSSSTSQAAVSTGTPSSIHLGVINFTHQYNQGGSGGSLSLIGTTAEVTSRTRLPSSSSASVAAAVMETDHEDFVLMARGRHRFEIIRFWRAQRYT